MPPQIFKNKVIATAGPLPRQLTVDNLKKWTELRRGTFLTQFDDTVTHLLCTRDQFRDKRNRIIKEALQKRSGRRNVKVVHYEWYEFSAAYNERIPEREYLMLGREADRRAKKREERRWQKGLEAGIKGVNPSKCIAMVSLELTPGADKQDLHHVYYDRDNFRYQITLVHKDPVAGYVDEKYVLTLWESNAKPHLHWFTAKLTKSKNGRHFFSPTIKRDKEHSIKWKYAFQQFKDLFKSVCKIEWEDRVSYQGTQPTAFQYEPPTGGKPVGRRLRHSHEYCLEINAQIKKELAILEPMQDDGDAEKNVEERTENGQDDDDDDEVDALREELMSDHEEEDDKNGNRADETGKATEVAPDFDEDSEETDESVAAIESVDLEGEVEEEEMEISTEDPPTQVEACLTAEIQGGESAQAEAMQEDTSILDEGDEISPTAVVEEIAHPARETDSAQEAADDYMDVDEDVANDVAQEYPTPVSISGHEEEQVIQQVDEAQDVVEKAMVQAPCDARCSDTGIGLPEEELQRQEMPRQRKKLPNERTKLPNERKKLPKGH